MASVRGDGVRTNDGKLEHNKTGEKKGGSGGGGTHKQYRSQQKKKRRTRVKECGETEGQLAGQ